MTYLHTALIAALTLTASSAVAKPADYHAEAQINTAASTTDAFDLKDIAATDPALSIREGAGEEPDAMVMLSDVLFEFGKDDLAPSALGTLEGLAQKLKGVEGLQITGHTDSIGSDTANYDLGLSRAETVRAWLVESGHLSADAIAVLSAGETAPIAANTKPDGTDDADGRALNRRVEFSIVETVQPETAAITGTHPSVF